MTILSSHIIAIWFLYISYHLILLNIESMVYDSAHYVHILLSLRAKRSVCMYIIYRFLCGFICVSLYQGIKIKPTKMYIVSTRAQFKINTHGCWNWPLCIPDGLSVVQCSLDRLDCVFLHTFGGMKRSCWSTGSWRCCLSLEVVSSIPAGSAIIHRFLCWFICVFLCQSIKIKQTHTHIYIYIYIYIYGDFSRQLPISALARSIRLLYYVS